VGWADEEELQNLCVKSYQTDNAGETHFNRGYFADAIEGQAEGEEHMKLCIYIVCTLILVVALGYYVAHI
jgi:hypothetical protein